MCRETEVVEHEMKMVPSSTTSLTTSSPLLPSLGTSHRLLVKLVTSRPARVWRVTRSEPEATRATHRQETKTVKRHEIRRCPCGDEDSFESEASSRKAGHLRLRFRLLAMENWLPASRLRHPIPAPPLPYRLTSCGTSHRGAPRANRTARTASSDPPRTQSQPPRRGTETCTER